MKLAGAASAVLLSLLPVHANPLPRHELAKRIGVNGLDDVLIFDSPGFPDPADANKITASIEAYVFLKQIDLSGLTGALSDALSTIGIDAGKNIDTALDRLKLFASVGVPATSVTVNVDGCSETPKLPNTAFGDLGLVTAYASLGTCAASATNGAAQIAATIQDNDFSSAKIFPSGGDGFGVISDIDDTVKISNVLDTLKLVQTTLFDDPTPVTGMPEVYASLAQSLNSPQFIYVSGSPYQLYPFLRDFIDTSFSASTGPIFLRNVTILNPANLIGQLTAGGDATLDYKVNQITRINQMYPNKSFLAVGDSTEKDPEVYAKVFNTFGGDFIRCIWIHVVDGANNTDARFSAAFEGVPQERIRLFQDSNIADLTSVDVAGGEC